MEANKLKILVADDEQDIREIIGYALKKEGYEVILAKDGSDAIEQAQKTTPDLILLDIMMPNKSGIQVCEILRSQPQFENTIIIFLTALTDDTIHVRGFETGADDYISKPISPKVLTTRINAQFRRSNKKNDKILDFESMHINPTEFTVSVNGEVVTLAKKEFELLYLLAKTPGRVFLRNEILQNIWGSDVIVGDRTIDVHIRKIRQKMGIDCIATIKGVGYKFVG